MVYTFGPLIIIRLIVVVEKTKGILSSGSKPVWGSRACPAGLFGSGTSTLTTNGVLSSGNSDGRGTGT
jgi:hypothetical protein